MKAKATGREKVKPISKTRRSAVDEYVAHAPAAARSILQKIRGIVLEEAPEAQERISYRMPAFFSRGVIIYFAAFTHHIGMFPPVKGNVALEKALARYRGEKGNLRFPLSEPIPYPLIRRIVQARLRALRAKRLGARRR